MPSVNEFLEADGVMIARLWRMVCKSIFVKLFQVWWSGFVILLYPLYCRFLDIERAAIHSIDAGHKFEPRFRLKQVIQPQATPLIVPERLAKALLTKRNASHLHLVINGVMRLVLECGMISAKCPPSTNHRLGRRCKRCQRFSLSSAIVHHQVALSQVQLRNIDASFPVRECR